MRLMLGWTWDGACRYAREHHWRINHTTKSFTDDDGRNVMFLRGEDRFDVQRLRGIQLECGGVLFGTAVEIHPEVMKEIRVRTQLSWYL